MIALSFDDRKRFFAPGELHSVWIDLSGNAYEELRAGDKRLQAAPFVLKEIFKKLNSEDDNSDILSFAFGPGLTLESILFKAKFL